MKSRPKVITIHHGPVTNNITTTNINVSPRVVFGAAVTVTVFALLLQHLFGG